MFEPWVGEHYGKLGNMFGGRRLLVVGESHYSAEHQVGSVVPSLTQDVMRFYGSGQRARWMRTLDNVAWAASGKGREELTKGTARGEFDVWSAMAFYNYIPVVLTDDARSGRPSGDQFKSGAEPFERVLERLDPEVLLVCGFELYPWIVRNHHPGFDSDPWQFKGEWIEFPRDRPIKAVRMIHPSTAFSPRKWSPVIQKALALDQKPG